jgi:MFS family permease
MASRLSADFSTFWIGQTVSLLGSQVSALALPLTAALVFGAGAQEMGVLNAARFLPFLLLTLPIGVLVDRVRRKRLLVATDVGRALLLALIPLSTLAGFLRIETLYVVAFCVGVLTVAFEVAWVTVAPWLAGPQDLVRANSRLMSSQAVAEVAGPPLAGQLVQLVTAPVAVAADALSFLVGAAAIARIRAAEPRPKTQATRSLVDDMKEGVRATLGNPYVRAIGLAAASYNLIETGIITLLILYALEIGFSPASLGLVLGCGAIGALVGSFVADRMGRRLGIGRALVVAMLVETVVFVPIAMLPDASLVSGTIFAAALLLNGWGTCVSTIHSLSVRQHFTAPSLLGRMNSVYRFMVTGTIPLGALLAGAMGEAFGLRTTILALALALPSSLAWLALSPVPRLRALPAGDTRAEIPRTSHDAASPTRASAQQAPQVRKE